MSHFIEAPSLVKKYRPSSWADVVAQSKALKTIDDMRPRGLAGRAWWISGQSGTGKTTIARLLAAEIADDLCIIEFDAGEVTKADIRELERNARTRGFGKGGRAIIINEAHGLRCDAIRQLLITLEEDKIPSHVIWIFTTTCDGQETLFEDKEDSGPLLSRCVELPLSRRDLAGPFAQRAMEIARAENLDGQPIEAYLKLAKECRNNFRMMLNRIDKGAMLAN